MRFLKLFFLFLFLNFIFAAENQTDLTNFAYGLKYQLEINPSKITTDPAIVEVKINIINDYDTDLAIYLLSKKNNTYQVEKLVGVVPKNSSSQMKILYQTIYEGKPTKKQEFAIVGKGWLVPVGFYLEINEDWTEYENKKNLEILNSSKFLIPIIGIGFVSFAAFLYIFYKLLRKHKENKTLFFFIPALKENENFAKIFYYPAFWIIGSLLSFLFLRAMFENNSIAWIIFSSMTAGLVLLIFILLILIYFVLANKFSLKIENIIGFIVWGMLIASFLMFINYVLGARLGFIFQNYSTMFYYTIFFIPFIYELLKGLGLYWLDYKNKNLSLEYVMLAGFSIGIGFAFIQNIVYALAILNPIAIGEFTFVSINIQKGIFNTLAEGCFSAFFGFVFLILKRNYLNELNPIILLIASFVSFILHSIFNILASIEKLNIQNSKIFLFSYNETIIVLLILFLLIFLIKEKIKKVFNL